MNYQKVSSGLIAGLAINCALGCLSFVLPFVLGELLFEVFPFFLDPYETMLGKVIFGFFTLIYILLLLHGPYIYFRYVRHDSLPFAVGYLWACGISSPFLIMGGVATFFIALIYPGF